METNIFWHICDYWHICRHIYNFLYVTYILFRMELRQLFDVIFIFIFSELCIAVNNKS